MMSVQSKSPLLLACSAAVLMAFAAKPAAAFDWTHWTWYADVDQFVHMNFNIDPKELMPTGLTQVESVQNFCGNLLAVATAKDVYVSNGMRPERLTFSEDHKWSKLLNANANLGYLSNAATAVANDISISSGVATLANIAQNHFGDIKAIAKVEDIHNLAINNSATAAANVASISVTPTYAAYATNGGGNGHPDSLPSLHLGGVVTDNIAMVNLNQNTVGDVKAIAKVQDASLTGYSGLGNYSRLGTTGLVINNTATALGNVATITNTGFVPPAAAKH